MPKFKIKSQRSRGDGGVGPVSEGRSVSGDSGAGNGQQHASRTLLSPNTSIGQHFLKNPAVVDSIVNKAQLR